MLVNIEFHLQKCLRILLTPLAQISFLFLPNHLPSWGEGNKPRKQLVIFAVEVKVVVPVFNHLAVCLGIKIVLFITLKQDFCASWKEMQSWLQMAV